MIDSILMVTHGMGEHSAEKTKKTVLDAANIALQRYPTYKNHKFDDYVDIRAIDYDDIFEEERQRLVNANKPVSEYFKAASNLPSLFIENIVNLEAEIGEDNFYTTHALDVLLYASLHCEIVRLRVLGKLSEAMSNKGNASFHVLAHSLGTAVIHDTLHKAFSDGFTNDGGETIKLDPVNNKLDSLWMVANVSRLMYALNPIRTTHDPMNTLVKPDISIEGCTRYFYNIHHELDPFTKFYRFDPQPNSDWLHPDDYEDFYRNYVTRNIGENPNPHDLTGYLIDPIVSFPFLKRVMPAGTFNPPRDEVIEAHSKVRNVLSELQKITKYVGEISSIHDFCSFLKMVKEYQAYIDSLKNGQND